MASEIEKYIEKRYQRWLDYAQFHCSCAGIADEANDVLNEVLYSLLQKSESKIRGLLSRKDEQYTELDYYVLKMIKLNATSETSPYRYRYKSLPIDSNVDYTRIDIEDVPDVEEDRPAYILEKMREVRIVLDELQLSEKTRRIFEWRFFLGEKFSDWPGSESEKELFDYYYKVISLIKQRLNNKTLF